MTDADVMTRPRPLRRFDPFRPIDMLTSLWSSAAVAPVSSGAAAAYRTLFMTVRRLVVGRRLTGVMIYGSKFAANFTPAI